MLCQPVVPNRSQAPILSPCPTKPLRTPPSSREHLRQGIFVHADHRLSSLSASMLSLSLALVALYASSAAATLTGCDVSHYQGTVSWSTVKADGASFAYIKATESTSVKDAQFSANYVGAYNAGLSESSTSESFVEP